MKIKLTVKDALTEMHKTHNAYKEIHKKYEDEQKKHGIALGQSQEKLDKANERLDLLEAHINGLNQSKTIHTVTEEKAAKFIEKRKALNSWMFKGPGKEDPTAGPPGVKVLIASNDELGGFLSTEDFVSELIKDVVEFSPVRGLARVSATDKDSVIIPKRTGTFAAVYVGEQGTRTETKGLKFGQEVVQIHEMYARVDISFRNLEDAFFPLEPFLMGEFAEQFAKREGEAHISGTASGQPEGLLTAADVTEVITGDATLLTSDGLIDLKDTPKTVYGNAGTWLMARKTISAVRKLKDDQKQYLWQPGLQGGFPALLLERPIVEAVDMPAIGAGLFPIIFGDIRRAYWIVDRIDMTVLRDPFSESEEGNIRFMARMRSGAQVTQTEAYAKQKVSA